LSFLSVNRYIQLELLRVGISMMLSCHVSGIMYCIVVKSVYVYIGSIGVSLYQKYQYWVIRYHVTSGMEVIFGIQV